MSERYDPAEAEPRWRARWRAEPPVALDLDGPGDELYNLVEFPYPSAEGLHVGHARTYCGVDAWGRFQRMRGKQVFQPFGFDSFGIHTENYAIRVGEHPRALTERTTTRYRSQLEMLGTAFDWCGVRTSDPAYLRWTQWIFTRLFRTGLAERKEAPVIWCPSCKTVLAFEQTEGDACERCGSTVLDRRMEQWFLRITVYADRLLDGLDELDWPEESKRRQRSWIGRSQGVDVTFKLEAGGESLIAFTTRVDTIFGATFLAIGPDDPRAHALTGRKAINPATGAAVPIVIADHVVGEYGTGAVMGVPAHDERDLAFARAHGLPVVRVIDGGDLPWTGEGHLIASGRFDGMASEKARGAIAAWLEQRAMGAPAVRYRLRDWLISRQRYWGPPIPIVWCDACGAVPVPDEHLPVVLPDAEDFHPTGDARSPLARMNSFVHTTCPRCSRLARRETDVSDVFLDSAWYFLRYPSAEFNDRAWDRRRTERWLPVDRYDTGREHTVRHHLYARFLCHALHDLGLIPFSEPFPRLRHHGMIGLGGAKMSKSRGNVVVPDDYVATVGADALRVYLLFLGPWGQGGEFSDAGLAGAERFLARAWRVISPTPPPYGAPSADLRELDRAVVRVTDDCARFRFNTAIAGLMELLRWIRDERQTMSPADWDRCACTFTVMLAPFAPHIAEELWARLSGPYSVHAQPWPAPKLDALARSDVTLAVQVDGRTRDHITVPTGTESAAARALALALPTVVRRLAGRGVRRIIFVPDRLINIVSEERATRPNANDPAAT